MTSTLLTGFVILVNIMNLWILISIYKNIIINEEIDEAPKGLETVWTVIFILNLLALSIVVLRTELAITTL